MIQAAGRMKPMDEERKENSPLEEGSEMLAHSAQAAYAVSAAAKLVGWLLVRQPEPLWQALLEHWSVL